MLNAMAFYAGAVFRPLKADAIIGMVIYWGFCSQMPVFRRVLVGLTIGSTCRLLLIFPPRCVQCRPDSIGRSRVDLRGTERCLFQPFPNLIHEASLKLLDAKFDPST